MNLLMRTYQGEQDYVRIRAFLRDIFLLNHRRAFCWETARFDYWRWHINANIWHQSLEKVILLWETTDGDLIAMLNPDDPGQAHLQIHPRWRSAEMEQMMLDIGEQHLAISTPQRKLSVSTYGGDSLREPLVVGRGYVHSWSEQLYRRALTDLLPIAPLTPGYFIRSLSGDEELPARSWASWRAFHPNAPDHQYQGWEWYRNLQRCPLYRRDLDLVVISARGEVAGFCTVWYDDVTCTGFFEPVGVVPEHQRRGLGKALLVEGMHRVKQLGGTLVTVAGASPEANSLYHSVMGSTGMRVQWWEKKW